MSPIQWQQSPGKDDSKTDRPSSSSQNNVWFGVSMALIGVLLGMFIGKWLQSGLPAAAAAPQLRGQAVAAVAPTPQPSVPTPPIPTAPGALTVPPVDFTNDHIRGSKNATVAVIEYSDFECPFCKRVHPTYQQIMQQYEGKVIWVFRHFPLSFHQNSEKEAEASECADELGGNTAFWKFTDGIFEKTASNGTGFPLDQLPVLAKQIGLNEQKFTSCLDSGKFAAKIKKEEDDASAGGVSGTPGNFIVNLKAGTARKLDGAVPFANFKSAIDASL